jgi:hypothetical protein
LNLYKALTCLSIAAPVFAQYAGPAILSRGEAPAAMSAPQIDFRPFLTVTGTYDTGLAGVSVNAQGQLASSASYGMQYTGGISGVHSWKHTKLSLNYVGAYNQYFQNTFYDSSNQSLSLGLYHQFSRRFALSLGESAGMYSQNFTTLGLAQTVPFDSSQSYLPVTDFYDNRTIFNTTQADVIYQKNARLSFDFGGSEFINRRRSAALYSVSGESARADVQYRLTRRTSVGVQYNYSRFVYRNILGSSDGHAAMVTLSTRLSRWWEFSAFGGVTRTENRFEQEVALDPAVAALLGYATAAQLVYKISYIPTFSGRLSRTFHRGVFWVSGARAVTPGNGLFLTSTMITGGSGYTYTGLRRWSFTGQVFYERGNSLGNLVGIYGDISGGVSVSRQIVRSLSFVAGADARRYQSPTYSQYNRTVYDAHFGLGWSPGAIPLRLW